jgi:hypothetical protein
LPLRLLSTGYTGFSIITLSPTSKLADSCHSERSEESLPCLTISKK